MLTGTALLLYGGDRLVQAAERDRLLSRIAAAEATADYADRRVSATLQYASPQLGGAGTSPPVRRSLERLVEQAAASQVAAVAATRTSAEGAGVLPWHTALRRARSESATYLARRLDRLRAGSQDIDVLLSPDPAAAQARERTRGALRAAGVPDGDVQTALGPP